VSGSESGKSPLGAAVLNFFFGLGYVYLGAKKVLGVKTIAFVVIAFILRYIAFYLLYILLGIFTAVIVSVIIAILFAVDGWQKGKGGKGFISAE
jgi:hypothetical protein